MNAAKKTIVGLGIGASVLAGGTVAENAAFDAQNQYEVRQEIVADNLVVIKNRITDAEVTLYKWDNEESLTIKRTKDQSGVPFLRLLEGSRKEHTIARATTTKDGAPAFEFDIHLDEKPDTNVFCLSVNAEAFEFAYQPRIDAQAVAEERSVNAGVFPDWTDPEWVDAYYEESDREEGYSATSSPYSYRPEEVIGQYAVFHRSKRDNQHGTGKLGDWLYPYVWEIGKEDQKQRAEDFTYRNGEMCVIAPQGFIDNADYENGVVIDPTFGYTSIGASDFYTGYSGGSNPAGLLGTLAEAGDITKLTAHVANTTTTKNLTSRIHAGSAGSRGSLLVATNSASVTTSYGWRDFTFSSPYSASSSTYWLQFDGDGGNGPGGNIGQIKYDTGGASNTSYFISDGGSPVYGTDRYSIHATYTAAAPPPTGTSSTMGTWVTF